MLTMLTRRELSEVWKKAALVRKGYPSSYANLMGIERLAVLPLLDEPLQSTLHQIVQRNVDDNTPCVRVGCRGVLDKTGHCSCQCEQLGINVVDDILSCQNCDCYEFPCPMCRAGIFRNDL